jgi:CO/xanthine dehydrogenase Mo-binding subunit
MPPGTGPIGSRLAVTLSGAVLGAADRVRQKLVKMASVLLEAPEADVELRDGQLTVRGAPQQSLALGDVVAALHRRVDLPEGLDNSLEASYSWNPAGMRRPDDDGRGRFYLTAANAAHLAEVEVDRHTGQVHITGYWIVDDCGTRLNPAIVDGQTQGGLAQGVGLALLEECVYDPRGQPLTTTYLDYLVPTVYEVPASHKVAVTTPSPFAPLGVKGCGEGAIHTTPAAIFCAVNDALSGAGVEIRELPMSPARIWRVLNPEDTSARARPTLITLDQGRAPTA